MPLDGDGGGVTRGGFTGWDTSQANQPAYNASGNWGIGNTFDGTWGNVFNGEMNTGNGFNGEMNTIGQIDPVVTNDAVSAMAPKANGDNMAVADAVEVLVGPIGVNMAVEVANGVEVEKVPEISVDAGVDVVITSEVSNGANTPAATIPSVEEKRTRKPAGRGEIIPLTTKDAPVNVPEWFSLAQTYLEDGLDIKDWRDCVETWVSMENAVGLSDVGSVCLLGI